MTEKQKSIAKLLTVSGIVIAVIVIIALVYNIVSLVNLNTRKNEITAQVQQLTAVAEDNQQLIEYRGEADYIERYARDYLNMMGQYEVAYTGIA